MYKNIPTITNIHPKKIAPEDAKFLKVVCCFYLMKFFKIDFIKDFEPFAN